jgi:hypothetical protein
MAYSSNPLHRGHELCPSPPLLLQHRLPGWDEPVIAPPALTGFLDPLTFNPPALFQPI